MSLRRAAKAKAAKKKAPVGKAGKAKAKLHRAHSFGGRK